MNDGRFVELCNYAPRVDERRRSDCPSVESASGSTNLWRIRENFVQLVQMAADRSLLLKTLDDSDDNRSHLNLMTHSFRSSLQQSMDLPPDKAKLLKSYDNEKKWDIICDQVRCCRRT